MRSQTVVPLALGLVLVGAVLTGSGADARPRRIPAVFRPTQAETFTVSGEFTGRLEGTIVLNGGIFSLARNARLHELGQTGPLPVGTFLAARRVTLAGVVRDGSFIVQGVIVRPAGAYGTYTAAESRNVGVLDARVPQ